MTRMQAHSDHKEELMEKRRENEDFGQAGRGDVSKPESVDSETWNRVPDKVKGGDDVIVNQREMEKHQ